MSLPGADELFRPTQSEDDHVPVNGPVTGPVTVPDGTGPVTVPDSAGADGTDRRRGSGRVRHDEKMTVYITADELLDLEHTRLALRRELGSAVDRGRLVREALAIVLADFDQRGSDSAIVHRLAKVTAAR